MAAWPQLRTIERARSKALSLALLGGAMLVAGCGGPVTARHPRLPAADSALCRTVPYLTGLVVRRNSAPHNRFSFSFPVVVTVKDPAAVRHVARALCVLPRYLRGPVHCPADFGITYELVFTAGQRRLPAVIVDATGCQAVNGLGPQLRATYRFWDTLGRAMGLGKSNGQAFRGTAPA